MPLVVPDPFALHFPDCTTYGGKPRIVPNRAAITSLLFKEVEQRSLSSQEPLTRLAKLFVLDGSLAIQEYLFSIPLDEHGDRDVGEVSLSQDALRLRRRNVGSRRSKRAEFVIDDLDESGNVGAMIRPQIPQPAQDLPLSADIWTVDYTSIYATVIGERMPYMRKQTPIGSRRFQDCLNDLTELVLSSGNADLVTAQTMYSDCDPPFLHSLPC